MMQKFSKQLSKIIPIVIIVFVAFAGNMIGSFLQSIKPQSPSITKGKKPQPPAPGASQEEQIAFIEALRHAAKEVDRIEIKNCDKIDPPVVRAKEDSLLAFKNSDIAAHRITTFLNDLSVTIPKGEEKMITVRYDGRSDKGVPGGPGWYGIRCDETEEAAFLEILPK